MNLRADRHASHILRTIQLGWANVSWRERVTCVCRVVGVCVVVVTTVAFAQSTPRGTNALQVRGNVERELTLGISDLQGLAVQRVEDFARSRWLDCLTSLANKGGATPECCCAMFSRQRNRSRNNGMTC